MSDQAWNFLEEVFLSNSISAALGRSSTYESPSSANSEALGKVLRSELCELVKEYASPVLEESHIQNIAKLAHHVTGCCAPLLKGGYLRFGVAHKALNLYLKFLWCAGRIPAPPHCPFDGKVIAELHKLRKLPANLRDLSWTQMNEATYRELVSAAKERLKDEPLAKWELRTWPATGCSET